MTKTFGEFLVDNDEQYTYFIRSVRNIHDPEVVDLIRLSLLSFDLRSITNAGYDPRMDQSGKMFPHNHGCPVYSLKVVTGTELISEVVIQKIAFFTNINHMYLFVHAEGETMSRETNFDEPEIDIDSKYDSLAHSAKDWNGTPDKDTIDPNAQDLVGNNRIGKFLKELEDDRKSREEFIKNRNIEPKLHESFVTSHYALSDAIGRTPLKGYYLIERTKEKVDEMVIDGPFKDKPINYDFVPTLQLDNIKTYEVVDPSHVKIIAEDMSFFFTKRLFENETKTYEVEVKDQDSGKTYPVVVKSKNETNARTKAINIVSRKEKIDKGRLIAKEPEVS
jgi:hypothetical protein